MNFDTYYSISVKQKSAGSDDLGMIQFTVLY